MSATVGAKELRELTRRQYQNRRRKPFGPGPGRPKGVPNFSTRLTREAIIEGLSRCGGKEGLVGFVIKAVKKDIRNGVTMLSMITPKAVEAHITHTDITFQTIADLDQDLAKNGLPPSREIFALDFKGTKNKWADDNDDQEKSGAPSLEGDLSKSQT